MKIKTLGFCKNQEQTHFDIQAHTQVYNQTKQAHIQNTKLNKHEQGQTISTKKHCLHIKPNL